MTKVFIDGSAGTTGLRIADRLAQRQDISLIKISEQLRKDPNARKDAIFSAATAKRLKLIAVLLFAECGLFCAGVAVLLCNGESLLAPVLGVVGLIGLMLAYVLLLLSRYVRQAAVLKEEVDATL